MACYIKSRCRSTFLYYFYQVYKYYVARYISSLCLSKYYHVFHVLFDDPFCKYETNKDKKSEIQP